MGNTINAFKEANAQAEFRCPHCNGLITELPLRKFQIYEIKVANWLSGKLPAIGEPGYDVYDCKPFPALTFQVKFSSVNAPRSSERTRNQLIWAWYHSANMTPDKPDYFILCGISEDETENWFVMRRDDFIRHSSQTNKKGARLLQGLAKHFSLRGANHRSQGYIHENTIWKYHCSDPKRMADMILRIESERTGQLSLLA